MSDSRAPSANPAAQVGADSRSDLSAPIIEFSASLARMQPPQAVVEVVDGDNLTVRLANVEYIRRFDEVRGDLALVDGGIWAAIGALVSLFVGNAVSADTSLDTTENIFVGAIVFVGIALSLLRIRFARRANRLRNTLFGTERTVRQRD